jgi:hypothetical protein
MKCDDCGQDFPAHEATARTRNVPVSGISVMGQKTEIAQVTLCPNCAGHRTDIRAVFVWTLGIAFILMAIAAVLASLFAALDR